MEVMRMKQNISITAQQSNKWNANIDKGSVSIKKVQYGVCLADKKERSTMHRPTLLVYSYSGRQGNKQNDGCSNTQPGGIDTYKSKTTFLSIL